jgi:hypothetical protein
MDRLEKLKELEAMLKANLRTSDVRSLAGIAKQYRETIKEIEEIEGGESDGDEIAELLESRGADGKAGAVRPDRS